MIAQYLPVRYWNV